MTLLLAFECFKKCELNLKLNLKACLVLPSCDYSSELTHPREEREGDQNAFYLSWVNQGKHLQV